MKNNILKALKIVIYLIVIGAAVGFVYHFIKGIHCSLFADDVITAQNRIESAYQFLYMVGNGVILVIALYSTLLVKVRVVPVVVEEKVKNFFSKIMAKLSKKNN